MENKNALLKVYSGLVDRNAPRAERIAAWNAYLAAANNSLSPRSSALRRNGRTFRVAFRANGTSHDLS